jgi:ADP-heptose:LPS heptosyltransferase
MGYGDEIIGSGLARGAHVRGKKIAFGDGKKILWSSWAPEIYANNPNVARPGDEGQSNLEWIAHYKGARKYNRLVNGKWVWNYDFKPVPGEFFFDEIEQAIAATFSPGFIAIEPNVPWQKTVAPNKDWGESKYRELARRLLLQGHRLVQFRHKNSRRLIEGADIIELHKFRHVIAALSKACLYIGPEGGMHHAAAAVGVKAVVLFGGFIPPQVTGYDLHTNLTGGTDACGHIEPCKHCQQAMANISVDQVKDAAMRQLENEMRNRHSAA